MNDLYKLANKMFTKRQQNIDGIAHIVMTINFMRLDIILKWAIQILNNKTIIYSFNFYNKFLNQ